MLWVLWVVAIQPYSHTLYCTIDLQWVGKTGRRRALLAVICVKETRIHMHMHATLRLSRVVRRCQRGGISESVIVIVYIERTSPFTHTHNAVRSAHCALPLPLKSSFWDERRW